MFSSLHLEREQSVKLAGSIQNAARILITLEGSMGGAWAEYQLKRQAWGRGASQERMLSLPQTIMGLGLTAR